MNRSIDANPRFEQAGQSILKTNNYGGGYRNDGQIRPQDLTYDAYSRSLNPQNINAGGGGGGYIINQNRDHIQNIPDFLYNRKGNQTMNPSPERRNYSKYSVSPEEDMENRRSMGGGGGGSGGGGGGVYENKTNFARNFQGRLYDFNPNDDEVRRDTQQKADLKQILLYQIQEKQRAQYEEKIRRQREEQQQEERYQRHQRQLQRENQAIADMKTQRQTNLKTMNDNINEINSVRNRTPKARHHSIPRNYIDQEVQANLPVKDPSSVPQSNNNNNPQLNPASMNTPNNNQNGINNAPNESMVSSPNNNNGNNFSQNNRMNRNPNGGMNSDYNQGANMELQAQYMSHMKQMQIQLYKNRILNQELKMIKQIDDLNNDIKKISSQNDLLQIRDDILHKLSRTERGNNNGTNQSPFLSPIVMLPLNSNIMMDHNIFQPVGLVMGGNNHNNNNLNKTLQFNSSTSQFLPGQPPQRQSPLDQLLVNDDEVFDYPYVPLQDIYGGKKQLDNSGFVPNRKDCQQLQSRNLKDNYGSTTPVRNLRVRRSSDIPTELKYNDQDQVKRDLAILDQKRTNPDGFEKLSSHSKKRRNTMNRSLLKLDEALPVPETIVYLESNMSRINNESNVHRASAQKLQNKTLTNNDAEVLRSEKFSSMQSIQQFMGSSPERRQLDFENLGLSDNGLGTGRNQRSITTERRVPTPYETQINNNSGRRDRPLDLLQSNLNSIDTHSISIHTPIRSRQNLIQSRDNIITKLNSARTFVRDQSKELDLRKTRNIETMRDNRKTYETGGI